MPNLLNNAAFTLLISVDGGKNVTTENESVVGTPRWVKVQGVFVLLLMLIVTAMSAGLIGGHGHTYDASSDREHHMDEHDDPAQQTP